MSAVPGAVGARAVAAEALAGQHRIEVAEQQQALAARAAVLGNEVPGTLHLGRQLDPARAEADGPQFRGEDIANRANAFDVLGRALDVHDAREQGLRRRLTRRGVPRDVRLGRVEFSPGESDAAEREYERPGDGVNQVSDHGGFPVAANPAR